MRNAITLVILLIATVVILYPGSRIEAQNPTAVLPSVVVRDSTGLVVGPVVGMESIGNPLVLFRDPTNSDAPVIILFTKDWFRTSLGTTFFTGADCTGTAYGVDPVNVRGLAGMRGSTYSRGPNAMIYGTLLGAAGTGMSIDVLSQFDSFDRGANGCFNVPNTVGGLLVATPRIDLSTFVLPFTVE